MHINIFAQKYEDQIVHIGARMKQHRPLPTSFEGVLQQYISGSHKCLTVRTT